MSNFIGYNNTLDIRRNIDLFMESNMANIMNMHKSQFAEEDMNNYSEKQYNVSLYYMALEYCTNLWFLILENTENETINDSEIGYKELYNFDDIKFNLAHYSIDLNSIFNDVKIANTKLIDTISLDTKSYIDYGYIDTDISNFAVRIKFSLPEITNEDTVIASFNELQSDNLINANNTYGIKVYYDVSSSKVGIRVSNSVYIWTNETEIEGLNDLVDSNGDIDIVFWLDYNYDPYPRYGFALNGFIPDIYSYQDSTKIGGEATFMGTTGDYSFKLNSNSKTILGGIYNGTSILSNGKVNIKHFEVAPFSKDAVLNMINAIKESTSVFRIDAANSRLKDEINNLLPINNTDFIK